jgi:uncharacterized protein YegL
MVVRPGGEYASRPLHFIWLLDCSGSMNVGGKIQALNSAIREAIPAMRQVAENNPEAQLYVRAIRFSNGAKWHVGEATLIDEFKWVDVQAGGQTDMGRAFSLAAEQMRVPPMNPRALPPFLVLVSDGRPTDDWESGLAALMAEDWGRRAVRTAIAIGQDADLPCLTKFIGHPERQVLQADNPEDLVKMIRWASTSVGGAPQGKDLPPPPAVDVRPGDESVW